jgi:hypothetical protein
MTLAELNYRCLKAHLLLAVGTIIGEIIAHIYGIKYTLLFGLLTGLLFSLHVYRQCIIVLINEYRNLKSKQNNGNEDI